MVTVIKYKTEHIIEEDHIYCANLEANNKLVKGHRLLNKDGVCVGLLSLDKMIEYNVKDGTIRRCEHNCHLCSYEWLGRCFGKHYGKDVSVDDMPICTDYKYSGSDEKLKEIES